MTNFDSHLDSYIRHHEACARLFPVVGVVCCPRGREAPNSFNNKMHRSTELRNITRNKTNNKIKLLHSSSFQFKKKCRRGHNAFEPSPSPIRLCTAWTEKGKGNYAEKSFAINMQVRSFSLLSSFVPFLLLPCSTPPPRPFFTSDAPHPHPRPP